EFMEAGQHEVEFDANNLASGIYIYKIQTNEFSETKKMVLLR
ncbi:MAG: T9SS type A sorting domain-containing protein, partial [Ignavibacterium sp.]|nr:T9SS type A sorting domain-containing protein [Ignavibacterium sp.]